MAEYKPKIGDRVIHNGNCGTVRYVGKIAGIKGTWVGLELDDKKGKNNGMAKGKRYFSCQKNHGIFCKAKMIKPLVVRKHKNSKSDDNMLKKRRVSIPGLMLTPLQEVKGLSIDANSSCDEVDESFLDIDTPVDNLPFDFKKSTNLQKNKSSVNNWLRQNHSSGVPYWVNPITQDSTWNQPKEWSEETENQSFRKKADLKGEAEPWVQITDPKSGRCYWANIETQESTWTKPQGWDSNLEVIKKQDEVLEIRKKRQALKKKVQNKLSRNKSRSTSLENLRELTDNLKQTEAKTDRRRKGSLDNLREVTEKAMSSIEQKTRSIRGMVKKDGTNGKDKSPLIRRRSKKGKKPMLEIDLGGKSPLEKQMKREKMKRARERMKKIKKNTLEMHGTNLRLLPLRRLQRRMQELEETIAANDVLIQKELKLANARANKRHSNNSVGDVFGRDYYVVS